MKDLPRAHDALFPAAELAEIRANRADQGSRAKELRPYEIAGVERPCAGQSGHVEVLEQNAHASNDKTAVVPTAGHLGLRLCPAAQGAPPLMSPSGSGIDPAGDALKSALARWEGRAVSHAEIPP